MSVLMLISDNTKRTEVHAFPDTEQAENYLEAILPDYTPTYDATGQRDGNYTATAPDGTVYRAHVRRGPMVTFYLLEGQFIVDFSGWHCNSPCRGNNGIMVYTFIEN